MTSLLEFLSPNLAAQAASLYGTPVYVYSESLLKANAAKALAFPNAFGLTVRFAMKAAPNRALLRLFRDAGLHIDASSGFEVERALMAGFPADRICLSAQELPANFPELIRKGIYFNACSLRQLEVYGQHFPGTSCGIRFNPGLGSGGTGKTNVGGPHSSFGIWHEWAGEVEALLARYRLTAARIHTHIGSGSDPAVWSRAADLSLNLVRRFPTVTTLNLGGGYKVARMPYEKATDLQTIGEPVKKAIESLATETGRRLHLEIEPGTFLVAKACSLVTTIHDVIQTGGPEGMTFYKVDSGMTEILRPTLYGAQHPTVVLTAQQGQPGQMLQAMIVGHNCESGDIITCAPGEPETLAPRTLPKASPGDLCVIEATGAYCAGMSAKNYNSFPEAPEVLLTSDGQLRLIRSRQTLNQIVQNEIP